MKHFPYNDLNDDADDNKAESSTAALATFCDKYEPATKDTFTDLFSTKEVQKIIQDHIGYELSLQEISDLLTQMQYTYQLEEGNFMWMVKGVSQL